MRRTRRATHYTVTYGPHVAKFSCNRDAMRFAEDMSREGGFSVEVEHLTGLVGQYRNGKTTPEFQLHHDLRDNDSTPDRACPARRRLIEA